MIDRYSRTWEETGHHRGQDLEAALDKGDRYDMLVFGRWYGDSCAEQDFFDGAMDKV